MKKYIGMKSSSGKTLKDQQLRKTLITFIVAVIVYLFYTITIYYYISSCVTFPNICKNASSNQAFDAAVEMTMSTWNNESDLNYVVYSPGCKIMDMDPFNVSVKPFINTSKPKYCGEPVAKLDKQKLTIIERRMKDWNSTTCCYRTIDRVQQKPDEYTKHADWKIRYSQTCHHIPTDNGNQGISLNVSFIKIECQNFSENKNAVEFHGIALPPKVNSKTTKIKAEYWEKRTEKIFSNPPSILIIGIDSVSRLHMIRSLPKTREFLQQNDFIEMKGYTKVGDNTFPNVMAGFGGMELDNYTSCWPNKSAKLDDCPFIWKKYSDLNYITAFLEDSPDTAIFNYEKVGFVLPPTDYYMRPLFVAAHKQKVAPDDCIGGVSETVFQTNFIKDFVQNMGKSYPYFLFSWFTSIGHDNFNGLKTADDTFHDTLSAAINKTSANPDNTVIIFMSDHGYRFGSFRETFLGYYEDNLPFFFFRLPPSLKDKYPGWYSNLKQNSRQLTSPLDLHFTLTHILNEATYKINNVSINSSKTFNSNSNHSKNDITIYSESTSPKFQARYSFFEYIPDNRTCENSSISEKYCMCGVTPEMSQPLTLSTQLGDTVISHVNNLLESVINSGECVTLKFQKFLYGWEVGHGVISNGFQKFVNYKDYIVALEAEPSEAHFESKVRILENSTTLFLGDINRINSYNEQSDCVSDFKLKLYCFCKNHII